jgi:hypothetical protein
MTADEILKTTDGRIEKHRKADVTVKVVDRQGKPVAGAQVEVAQTRDATSSRCSLIRVRCTRSTAANLLPC